MAGERRHAWISAPCSTSARDSAHRNDGNGRGACNKAPDRVRGERERCTAGQAGHNEQEWRRLFGLVEFGDFFEARRRRFGGSDLQELLTRLSPLLDQLRSETDIFASAEASATDADGAASLEVRELRLCVDELTELLVRLKAAYGEDELAWDSAYNALTDERSRALLDGLGYDAPAELRACDYDTLATSIDRVYGDDDEGKRKFALLVCLVGHHRRGSHRPSKVPSSSRNACASRTAGHATA